MQHVSSSHRKRGIALVLVLASLSVLTVLFAITSSLTLTKVQSNQAATLLLKSKHLESQLLQHLAKSHGAAPQSSEFQISVEGQTYYVKLVDVGTLVDLNTAMPAFLEAIADQINIGAEGLTAYRDWRRTPRRLLRVSDFIRITNADIKHLAWLQTVATVFSGRTGVHLEAATPDIAALYDTALEKNRALGADISALTSQPTQTIFKVFLSSPHSPDLAAIGTIRFSKNPDERRILWAR